jgi:recombination protein RecT
MASSPRPFTYVAGVVPRLAATTLILRDAASGLEVLMVRRSVDATFMPGAYVFPGGAVDDEDKSPASVGCCDESATRLAARIGAVADVERACAFAVAALRECFEECGLWLGDSSSDALDHAALRRRLDAGESIAALAQGAGVLLATSILEPWSRWVTPAGMHKRFDTMFFVARAPAGQTPSVDAGETTTLIWVQPREALRAHAAGELPMEFATLRTVDSLAPFAAGSVDALLAHARAQPRVPVFEPRLQLDAAGRIAAVLLPGSPGYDEALRA